MTSAALHPVKFCPACRERFPDEGVFCPNDGSPLVAELPDLPEHGLDPYLERTILDHIKLSELVGIGAMGRVYRAFQRGIDRDVAVKVLHRELSANAQLVLRFLREAKVASRLQHPNVVHVLLSGQLPDGALYIVMEFLHGVSLHTALAETDFDLSRALHVTLQLCDAVGEAHVQGIVHRDLKPENVMLVRRGQDADFVKVLDFGIARLNWSEQSMSTATGLIFGTARYISPEGAQGEKVGPPGDVYSIATLAYQMLAGRTPFEGDQAVGLLIQQIHEAPPPLRSHASASEVPPAIADVIMRGLAKNPEARYDGARSFGRALVEAARASGVAGDDYYSRALFAATPPASGSSRTPPPSSDRSGSRKPPASTPDIGDAQIAASTARWTPPAAVQAQLSAIASDRARARTTPQPPVEPTLDDDDIQSIGAPLRQRTEYQTPAPMPTPSPQPFSGTVRMASNPELQTPIPASRQAKGNGKGGTLPLQNGVEPVSDERGGAAKTRSSAPSEPDADRSRPTPRPSASGATTSVASHAAHASSAEERTGRGSVRTIGIVVLCFLVGVGGAVGLHLSGVLSRWGSTRDSGASQSIAVDAHVSRVRDALERERWDEPPGDNVRELITSGLTRWPNEPRLVQLRAQASETMVRRAVMLKSARDLAQAARLARVASELVPDNDSTRALAAEYAHELESTASAGSLKPITSAPIPSARPANGGTAQAMLTSTKATLETNPAKPRIAQSVQLLAKVSGKGPIADPAFVILAAGQNPNAATKLVPVTQGNVFRASFTFLEAGRYEVSFTARGDVGPLKVTKSLVVEGPQAAPAPETPPAPSGSVKWL